MPREIQKGIYDNALYLFLWHCLRLYGVSKRVKGFVPSIDGTLKLDRVTLAP